MSASIFFLIVALCICTLVIIQVRNLKMKEKYAALWLGVGAAIIVLGIFPGLLDGITGFVGGFTFNLSKLNDEERQLITILLTFGQHCGVGRLSSQGLGQVRVTLHTK